MGTTLTGSVEAPSHRLFLPATRCRQGKAESRMWREKSRSLSHLSLGFAPSPKAQLPQFMYSVIDSNSNSQLNPSSHLILVSLMAFNVAQLTTQNHRTSSLYQRLSLNDEFLMLLTMLVPPTPPGLASHVGSHLILGGRSGSVLGPLSSRSALVDTYHLQAFHAGPTQRRELDPPFSTTARPRRLHFSIQNDGCPTLVQGLPWNTANSC